LSDHGGNIYAAARRTGIPKERILDFSASINPLGVPKKAARMMRRAISRLNHYPEPYAEELALRVARNMNLEEGSVITGNGSTELIYLIPRALRPRRALIPEPTFRLYREACRVSGVERIESFPLIEREHFDVIPEDFIAAASRLTVGGSQAGSSEKDCAMAFLCNPNNPTGRLVSKSDVLAIADAAAAAECYIVLDEAFMDFCPEDSVAREVATNPYLIVIRSMTKFYALSGLRIGYGVFHPTVASRIRAYKEPWTVNSLAQTAAFAALDDDVYQKDSIEAMTREKTFLENGLTRLGIRFTPSRANYYLIRLAKAQELREGLERKGILVRDCSNFAGLDATYLRIAVRSRSENRLLLKELADLCEPS
jgi:threonine-phosphate decarboxylase